MSYTDLFMKINSKTDNDTKNNEREQFIADEYNKRETTQEQFVSKILDYFMDCIGYSYEELVGTTLVRKGGRRFNYDFELLNDQNKIMKKIEFKYNASSISKCPQFHSIFIKQLFQNKLYIFENYMLDTMLPRMFSLFDNLHTHIHDLHTQKERDCYLKQLYKTTTKKDTLLDTLKQNQRTHTCSKYIKSQYNTLVYESIDQMVSIVNEHQDLYDNLIQILHDSLQTQKDKTYMLFDLKNQKFVTDDTFGTLQLTKSSYHERTVLFKSKNSTSNSTSTHKKGFLIHTTHHQVTIECLFRWKNTNGIQNPAVSFIINKS